MQGTFRDTAAIAAYIITQPHPAENPQSQPQLTFTQGLRQKPRPEQDAAMMPFRCRKRRLHAVALLEAVNAATGIHQFLLAGIEGVALGADFNPQVALDGAGLKGFAASATNDALAVYGMDVFLHECSFLSIAALAAI
jgi:hypothetical protein